jgi:hypothetical protein
MLRSDLALVLAFALIKLAIHLGVGAGYGYHRDELYYLACADHLAWGYVDHPPFAVVMLAIVRLIAGDSVAAIRIVPALAGAVTVVVIGLMARRLGGGRFAQVLAMTAAVAAPFYLALDSYFSMNAFDLLIWSVAGWLLINILQGAPERWYWWLGLVLGLGLENKISVLWLGFGLTVGLLLTPQRAILRTRGPWIAAGIALALFAPHVIWQVAHRFPTVDFMRNAASDKLSSHTVAAYVRAQLDGMLIISMPVWIAGLAYYLWLEPGRRFRSLGWAWIAVFLLLAFTSTSRAAYLAPAYTWLLAAGGVALERAVSPWRSGVRIAYLALILLAGISAAPAVLPLLPKADLAARAASNPRPPDEERRGTSRFPEFLGHMDGWPEIVDEIADVYGGLPEVERNHAAILAPDYGMAGAVDLFGRVRGLPPALSAHNSYWSWGLRGQHPETFIVIDRTDKLLKRWFTDVHRAGETRCDYCMSYDNHQPIWIARGLRLPPGVWWAAMQTFQ